MSDISSIGPGGSGNVNSVGPVNRVHLNGVNHAKDAGALEPPVGYSSSLGADRVELSNFAVYLDKLRQLPSLSADRIGNVRHEIESGTYETPVKLDIALERLIDELDA